ncbi:MAG: hypothetical protein Q9217_007043, partial [Psora testacea]
MDEEVLHHRPSKNKPRRHIEYVSLRRGEPKKYYKPLIHHTASLCFLLVITLSLIGLIEYALRVLPQHQLSPGKSYGQVKKRELLDWRERTRKYEGALPGANVPIPNAATLTSGAGNPPLFPRRTPEPTPPGLRKRTPPKAGHANTFAAETVTQTVIYLKAYQIDFNYKMTDLINGTFTTSNVPLESPAPVAELFITRPLEDAGDTKGQGGSGGHAGGNLTVTETTTSDSTTFLDTRAMK